ncbi:MAG: hypothetical protein HS111_06445 [Kofleriaceae bacterium]|nr:hypothetical protein [Kofleriaceae bacterium]
MPPDQPPDGEVLVPACAAAADASQAGGGRQRDDKRGSAADIRPAVAHRRGLAATSPGLRECSALERPRRNLRACEADRSVPALTPVPTESRRTQRALLRSRARRRAAAADVAPLRRDAVEARRGAQTSAAAPRRAIENLRAYSGHEEELKRVHRCGGSRSWRAAALPARRPASRAKVGVAAAVHGAPLALRRSCRTSRASPSPAFTPRSPGRARSSRRRATTQPHPSLRRSSRSSTAWPPTAGRRLALGMQQVRDPVPGRARRLGPLGDDRRAGAPGRGPAGPDGWATGDALALLTGEGGARARAAGMALLALNAPRELVKAVSRKASTAQSAGAGAAAGPGPRRDAQHRAADAVMDGLAGLGHGDRPGARHLH